MRTITKDQLAEILAKHKEWRESGGEKGARANLARANLARADLTDANLADANLPDGYSPSAVSEPTEPYDRTKPIDYAARAKRYREAHPEVPVIERLDAEILARLESGAGVLDMGDWHSCETTHCRTGWAVHLAGAKGYELEKLYGPGHAGRMIYRSPHFFATTERALEDIRARAAEQTGGVQP